MGTTLRFIAAAVGTFTALAVLAQPVRQAYELGGESIGAGGLSALPPTAAEAPAARPVLHTEQVILVPLPAPVYIGAAGLIGVALVRKRVLRHR